MDSIEIPSSRQSFKLSTGQTLELDLYETQETFEGIYKESVAASESNHVFLRKLATWVSENAGVGIGIGDANYLYLNIPALILKKNRTWLDAFQSTQQLPPDSD